MKDSLLVISLVINVIICIGIPLGVALYITDKNGQRFYDKRRVSKTLRQNCLPSV